jgi:hypothetical protein
MATYNQLVGSLDQLEAFIQDLLERPAWLLSERRIQPLELASAISRELEERSVRVSDRIVVPNAYTISLSHEDFNQIEALRSALENELAAYVERLAAERALSLPADPVVVIRSDPALRSGRVVATAADPRSRQSPSPLARLRWSAASSRAPMRRQYLPALTLLGVDGEQMRSYSLDHAPVMIGRRSDNDISLPDLKVSRHHARIDTAGGEWYLTDLDSTNGTRINGDGLTGRKRLWAGDIIELGLQRLRFDG